MRRRSLLVLAVLWALLTTVTVGALVYTQLVPPARPLSQGSISIESQVPTTAAPIVVSGQPTTLDYSLCSSRPAVASLDMDFISDDPAAPVVSVAYLTVGITIDKGCHTGSFELTLPKTVTPGPWRLAATLELTKCQCQTLNLITPQFVVQSASGQ